MRYESTPPKLIHPPSVDDRSDAKTPSSPLLRSLRIPPDVAIYNFYKTPYLLLATQAQPLHWVPANSALEGGVGAAVALWRLPC